MAKRRPIPSSPERLGARLTRATGSLIRALGLTPCHGIGPTGHYCHLDHHAGEVSPGMVHIVDRPLTRWPDIQRFLMLCARAMGRVQPGWDEPVWQSVYSANMASREIGARLHIRVPAHYHRLDKAMVLAGVAGISNDAPLRKQAFDWARR